MAYGTFHQYDLKPRTQIQTQYLPSGEIVGGPTYIYDGPIIHSVNQRNGVSLPNWRTIIRNGGNATTPFTGTLQSFKSTPCSCYTESWENLGFNKINRYDTMGFNGLYGGYGNVSTFWADYFGSMEQAADALALKYLYARLREDQTAFRGGIFIGELREAISMIRNPAKSLRKLTNDYFSTLRKRRKEATSLKRAKAVLADSWLEYSFGWKPLLNDISEGINAYERIRDNSFVRRTFSATGEVEGEYVQSWTPDAAGQVFLKSRRITKTTLQVRYKVGTSRDLTGQQSTEGMANLLGVGWRDFVPTIWELTPWSFLIDYFANVGEILDAATTITSDITWVCKTVRKTRTYKIDSAVDVERTKQASGQLYIDTGGSAGETEEFERKITRSSLSSLPFPSFRFQVPGVDSLKWINIAALASSRRELTPYFKLRI